MEKERKKLINDERVASAIRPYKIIAQCLGIWCMTCHNFIPKFQVTVIYILLGTAAVTILYEFNPKCGEIKNALVPLSFTICIILSVAKILSIQLKKKEMLMITTSFSEDWSSVKNDEDFKIMDSTTGISRKMLICQLVSAFISDLPLLLCGLGNSEEFNRESNLTEIFRAIPLPTRCFYKDILDFYIEIYALQVLQIIALVMANLGCDCYFFGIGMNLVSQIRRFANDLERFEPQSDELKNQQTLRVMIRQHTHLIQMAAHLEEIFSFVIALQVLASVYQISSAGVQVLLSIRWSDPATAMSYSIYVCIFLMQLAIYNYAGECLSSSISSLQRSLYQCSWYHLSPKASRDFLFIMTRCGKRFHLTAGRIIPMNLESYKSIIKTLGSYFSVMQAMFDE